MNKSKALLFTALLAIYGIQLWYHATRTSATIDEPFHIVAGYRYWQCGDYGINPEHPPLLKLLAALPIRSQTLSEPSLCGSKVTAKLEGFAAGGQFLSQNGPDRILIPARLSASLLSVLLAVVVFLAAYEMFGPREAFLALALFVFEPNLIAHGSLVTTDMAFAATTFAAMYAVYRYRNKPNLWRLLLCGITTALMLASKHTGIIIVPVLFLLLLADTWWSGRKETQTTLSRRLTSQAAVFATVFLIGLLGLWASYGFRYYAIPGATSQTLKISTLIDGETEHSLTGKAVALIERTHIFPESYVYGLADIISIREPLYFLGKVYSTGRWFYFPITFTIKTSIPLLLLLLIAPLAFALYRDRYRELFFLLLPPLTYFAISLTSSFNLGVRHILVVYPFLIVIAAAAACWLLRRYRNLRFVLFALLLFHAFTPLRIAPNYIAFINDLWGGPNNAYRLFNDSNVDWGQNLKIVDEYLTREKIDNCWLAYFGSPELGRINQRCRLIPAPAWTTTGQLVEPVPRELDGTVLISATVTGRGDIYDELLKEKPVAILGGGILVYRGHFEMPQVQEFTYVSRGRQALRLKLFDEAIADGRRAMELAPNDSRASRLVSLAIAARGWNHLSAREGQSAVDDSGEYLKLEGWRGEMSTYMVLVAHYGYRLQQREQEAREILEECAAKCDTAAWPYPIVRYLQKEINANDLKRLSADSQKMTETRGYIGMDLSLGGRLQEALQEFNWVKENGNREFYEYELAISEINYIEELLKKSV